MIYIASQYCAVDSFSVLGLRGIGIQKQPPLGKQAHASDPRCNNASLQRIMQINMSNDTKHSKLAILHAAEKTIGGAFSVICSSRDFSYIAKTRLFCLVSKKNNKCFAFLAEVAAGKVHI
ncbi:ground-like domain-containing protein [Ditylenchus destructor]|uniref:Ground-like domain-containing protein n=1 Tax=Ditylenchus destructor TaxID=166010 RepID=A0AAD4R474_9BILA|nr:ground-like domain-containing protein [Ditylenchus destructor]